MTRTLKASTLVALLFPLLAACEKTEPIGKARIEEGQGLVVGHFDFLERSGKPLSDTDLKGKVWIGALIFTTCNGPCPRMCEEMARLQDDFADAPDFRMVTTTVDPAHDTADVLARFAKGYQAKPDRWYFLTGRPEDIQKFAVEGLRLAASTEGEIGHSPDFVLVDRSGRIRDYFRQADPEEMKRMRTVIRAALAEKTP
ncbi:MAG TPA: SCO family protein [Planctomycetota bacterium]|nr:SCO family protein [Planctomycetota bacterium]